MRIRDIEVISLRFEYPARRRFRYAGGVCTGRLTNVVKVHTDDGLVGLGSVYSHPDLVRTIINGQLGPLLLGEDPLEIERLWNRCYIATRWYGRKGVAVSAIGGVDIALWDLRGKALGKPVYKLLGATRSSVPAYASGMLWKDDPAELRDEAQRHLAEGFRAVKMRLGRSPEYDRGSVTAVRQAIGTSARLMVDGNARYTLEQVRRILPEFRSAGVFWLEEPFAPEDPDLFLALQPDLGGIPLAAGENEFGLQGFRELIDPRLVQIVQPDCCRCGGLSEALRIAELAQRRGLHIAPHTWSDAVALTANMHFVAATPQAITVEVDRTGNPFIDDLLLERRQIENGRVLLSDAPGLGIELDEDTVERYRVPADSPTPPGNYSDMVFK